MKVVLLYLLQHLLGSWMIAHLSVLTAGLGILLGLVSHCTLYLFVTGFGSVHGTINCKESSTACCTVHVTFFSIYHSIQWYLSSHPRLAPVAHQQVKPESPDHASTPHRE